MVIVGGGMAFAFTGGGSVLSLKGFQTPLILALVGGFIGAVGLAMFAAVVLWGLFFSRRETGDKKLWKFPDSRIIARFAVNSIGETVFSEDHIDFDDPKTKLYLKLTDTNQEVVEMTALPEAWTQAGEGMRGVAIVQGRRVVAFAPAFGPGATEDRGDLSARDI